MEISIVLCYFLLQQKAKEVGTEDRLECLGVWMQTAVIGALWWKI